MKTQLRKLLVLVTLISLIMVTATVYSLQTGRELVSRYAPLVDAAMEIKLEATTGHLWFEEAISGDRTVDIETIWKHLDQSEWYARAMLDGGTNSEGIFIPLNDLSLRSQIEQTIQGLHHFRQLAQQRWNERSESGIGSDIDQRFDKSFSSFILSADNVETALQKVIAEELQHFEIIEVFLIVIILAFGVIVGLLFYRHDSMQTKTLMMLHDREENLRITLNSIGDAVIVTDVNGLITYMNPIAIELTGWTLENALEKPVLDVFNIIHAHTKERVQNPVEKVLKMGSIVGLANHTMLIAKDGTEYQIADSGAPIHTPDGHIDGVVLVFRDVTEEYSLHESLKENEALIHTLINTIPDLIWLKDIDGVYISCNTKFEQLFGAERNEIIGKTDYDFVDSKLADSFRNNDRAALKANKPRMNEEQITYASDGHIELVETTKTPMIDSDGKLVGILGIAHDITDRKNIEAELRVSEERWNFALEGTRDGVWDWNVETGEVLFSSGLIAMLGYDDTDLAPNIKEWEARLHPHDKESSWLALNKHFNHETDHYENEHRILCKDGTYKWILDRGKVVTWTKENKPLRMIGTHIDLSERKQADQRFKHIFDNSLTEIFIFDAETYQFLKVNRGATANIGYSSEELLKLTPLDIKPEMSLEQFNTLVEPLRNGSEEIIHFETTHQRKNGTHYPVEIHLQLTDYALKAAFIAIILDITDRKAAMDKLQLSSRVFSDTHEGITITDANRLIIDVNPAFSAITGYSLEEVQGQNPRILGSGRQSPEFYQAMWKKVNDLGHWHGEVWNRKKNGELYAELLTISALLDENDDVMNYVGVFSDITQSKQQQEKLSFMAHYDVLTGLPNRALFTDRFYQAIAHSKRTGSQLAVCFLDLDSFKPVNDNYGHEVGDLLLIEVAKRIKANIREEDTVSRQGGDEFALLLNNIDSYEQCQQTLERIHDSLARPYLIDDHSHTVTASSGVTLYPTDDGDIDTLLRHADQAMYQAKLAGKHRYHLFNPEIDRQTIDKSHQLDEIENALRNNEFTLYYQPKVNMVTGHVFGVEALIRWNHPEKGLVPPLNFLPMIEDTLLEIALGNWVINSALTQLNDWQQRGLTLEVSINISSNHLLSENFYSQLDSAIKIYPDLDPSYIQLEILESSALGDLNAIGDILKSCQTGFGVNIALDDFGTGYSSLTHLRNLPTNTVKIDQSFVRDMLDDPSDYAIIEGIIGLANSFNRQSIAEGVETIEHGLMLIALGCDQAQGYILAKPMPAEDFVEWLNNYEPYKEWLDYGSKEHTPKETKTILFKLASDHWRNTFIENIQSSPSSIKHWPIMNSSRCHCGYWLNRTEHEHLFEGEELNLFKQAHEKSHAVAHDLRDKYQGKKFNAAREGLEEFQAAVNEMDAILDGINS